MKKAKRIKAKWIKFGQVGVDSGQLLVCDPCYLGKEYQDKEFDPDHPSPAGEFSYNGICQGTIAAPFVQLNYKLGHPGAGVAFSSGYGDGCYDVYGRLNSDGRVVEIRIVMDATDVQKQVLGL